jgi:hypothetical protein
MAEMLAEVYKAFRSAGVPEDEAEKAASALTSLRDEPWKRGIEKELTGLRTEIVDVRGVLRLHSWMLGTVIAMLTALLFKVFS